jgi:hypothetical protein
MLMLPPPPPPPPLLLLRAVSCGCVFHTLSQFACGTLLPIEDKTPSKERIVDEVPTGYTGILQQQPHSASPPICIPGVHNGVSTVRLQT